MIWLLVVLNLVSKLAALALIVFGGWAWTHVDHSVGGWCVAIGLMTFVIGGWSARTKDDD